MMPYTIRYPFFKGRVALFAILQAAGIGDGDQVLVPGYTCVVVPNAIRYTGAEPIYLDVDSHTGNLDCDKLEANICQSWDPARTRAIITQHTYGIPCNMDRLCEFASRYNLLVIEDSCHALGSKWNNHYVGTQGDAAFFSSQWSKPVTTGLGGWAQVNSPHLRDKLEATLHEYNPPRTAKAIQLALQFSAFRLLNHPRLFWIIQNIYRNLSDKGLAIGSSTKGELCCELPDEYQTGMHSIQLRQLSRLIQNIEHLVETRKSNSVLIENTLRKYGLPIIGVPSKSDPVFLRYPVQVSNKSYVLAEAQKHHIQLGDWFLSPIHPNLQNWGLAGYKSGTCPVAEELSRRVVNIPTGLEQNDKEILRTVEFLSRYGQGFTVSTS